MHFGGYRGLLDFWPPSWIWRGPWAFFKQCGRRYMNQLRKSWLEKAVFPGLDLTITKKPGLRTLHITGQNEFRVSLNEYIFHFWLLASARKI